jgi:arginase family enzyme
VTSAAGQWTLVGAPLDSSGAGRGEKNAPGALRTAGLVDALGVRDAGDADTILTDATRDPVTGLIGFSGLVRASQALRSTLRGPLSLGSRPLVIGGDCTILLGILAAMRDHDASRIGLWFLDGHADFYDGSTSSTGECADMELAIATGHGPAGLADLVQPPLVAARDVVLLGHRRAEDDPVPRSSAFFQRACSTSMPPPSPSSVQLESVKRWSTGWPARSRAPGCTWTLTSLTPTPCPPSHTINPVGWIGMTCRQ